MLKPLKVLVCSANLGNADPSESINLWIPENGYTGKVLNNQKYKVVETDEDWEAEGTEVEDDDYDNQEKGGGFYGEQFTEVFDIIAIGTQEATWEPPSSSSESSSTSTLVDDFESQDALGTTNHSSGSPAKKVAQTLKKSAAIAGKAVATVSTLTTSRDHTKKANEDLAAGDGTAILHNILEERLPQYKRLMSFQRGEMRLLIYTTNKNRHVSWESRDDCAQIFR